MLGHGQLQRLDADPMPRAVKLFDLNPRGGSFGPEIGFAHTFLESESLDQLWLVKYAVGGSSLLAWEADWSSERAAIADDADKGPLYQRLLRHFEQVTQDEEVEVLACLWMQGESDSRFQQAAADYQANLKRLIARIRADLDQAEMRFVIGLVNPSGAKFAHLSTVRAAQRLVAETVPNVSFVDTAGLSKHDDKLHYDTAGQLELGRRFALQLCRDLRRDSAAQSAD